VFYSCIHRIQNSESRFAPLPSPLVCALVCLGTLTDFYLCYVVARCQSLRHTASSLYPILVLPLASPALSTQKLGFKRIFLFTNNDNPNQDEYATRERTIERAKVFFLPYAHARAHS